MSVRGTTAANPRSVRDFDPWTGDPVAQLEALREQHGPLFGTGALGSPPVYLVLTNSECKRVLADHGTYSSRLAMGGGIGDSNPPEVMERLPAFLRDPDVTGVVDVDPPVHDRYRATLRRAFDVRWIRRELRPRFHQLATEIAASLTTGGRVDLVRSYTTPFTRRALATAMGVSPEMVPSLESWAHDAEIIVSPLEATGIEAKRSAVPGMHEYAAWAERFVAARCAGNQDLITVYARGDADRAAPLPHPTMLYSLLVHYRAGTVTTGHALGSAIDFALRTPGVWERLTAEARVTEPSPAEAASEYARSVFEEALRCASPHRGLVRITDRDTELAGHVLPKGTRVLPMLQSAGNDPDVFEAPSRFRTDRSNVRDHLAFGHGKHLCAGAELAREKGAAALLALARQAPTLRLEHSRPPVIEPSFFFHGPRHLWAVP